MVEAIKKMVEAINKMMEALNKLVEKIKKMLEAINKMVKAIKKMVEAINKMVKAIKKMVEAINKFLALHTCISGLRSSCFTDSVDLIEYDYMKTRVWTHPLLFLFSILEQSSRSKFTSY